MIPEAIAHRARARARQEIGSVHLRIPLSAAGAITPREKIYPTEYGAAAWSGRCLNGTNRNTTSAAEIPAGRDAR